MSIEIIKESEYIKVDTNKQGSSMYFPPSYVTIGTDGGVSFAGSIHLSPDEWKTVRGWIDSRLKDE